MTEQRSLLAQADTVLTARVRYWAGDYDARSGRLAAVQDPDIARGAEIVLLLTPSGRVVQTLAAGRLSAVKAPWDSTVQSLRAVAQRVEGTIVEQGLLLTTSTSLTKDGLTPAIVARPALFRITGTPLPSRRRVTALLVVGIRSDVAEQLATLARTLETIVPLTLILCAGGGYWLADRALLPIRTITRSVHAIGATDLSKRLNLRRRDDLGQLANTLDHMLGRLEDGFTRQRQFTADASHELRTPLTIVELEATRALARPRTPTEYRQAIVIMQEEARHMARLVDGLLTLARADSGEAVQGRAEVDLGEIVLDAVERLEPLAQRSGMALIVESLPEDQVWGDADALTRLVTNIVENALKYGAGQGTQVRLNGGSRRHNEVEGMWLRVADDGPGIAVEHLPHLGERFFRVDRARTHSPDPAREAGRNARPVGSGLGLAICRQIVDDQGGTLHIASDGAHGTVVDIWLPVRST